MFVVLYLYCGMLPWNAFQEGLNRSAGVILEYANLGLKRTVFPQEILPAYVVLSSLVNELIGLVILLGRCLRHRTPAVSADAARLRRCGLMNVIKAHGLSSGKRPAVRPRP